MWNRHGPQKAQCPHAAPIIQKNLPGPQSPSQPLQTGPVLAGTLKILLFLVLLGTNCFSSCCIG